MAVGIRERVKEGDPKTPTRYASKKQEEQVAKETGGHRQPNSGATPWAPGDVVADKILIECKTKMTDSASVSVKKAWIEKNKQEAIFRGLPYNALAINFGPDQANYYIIDEFAFQDFLDYIQNK